MWALIGLMLLRGMYKSQNEPASSLWSGECGRNVFKAKMSFLRYQILLKLMRFDDRETRKDRKKKDRFAPNRALFEKFDNRCQDNYTLSDCVTIDETLRRFRGRCKFQLYMPQKPGKYGLLFRVLADAKSRYVHHWTERLRKKRYHGSLLYYYTSADLCEQLRTEYKLTVVGTVKTNSRGLPELLKQAGKRDPESTIFAWNEKLMLVSYVPKKNKNVLMLTTMFDQPEIDNADRNKLVVI